MINSTSNKQVKRVANLRDKAKARREEGVYVAEGLRMCREYKPDDVEILYITESFGKQEENKKWLRGFKFEIVTDEVMHYMADTKTPQGVLAVAKQKKCTMEDILKQTSTPKLIMILENIQDPSNMGAIFRSAEAFGLSGVLLAGSCCDVYAPKAVRAGMGAVFRLRLLHAPDGVTAAETLHRAGIRTFAAVAHGDARPLRGGVLGAGCAVFIGNEGNGLRPETAAACRERLTIPMRGRAESLNAAAAAAILTWAMADGAAETEGAR